MFFFIIGTRGRAQNVALLQLVCRNGHVAAHRLVKVTRWFTVFFVPVIPIRRRYISVCAACGAQLHVPKEAAEEMIARAQAPSGTGGAVDPVSPPLPAASDPAAGAGAQAGPPAGWYTDPAGTGGLRWWDGRAWTQTVQQS